MGTEQLELLLLRLERIETALAQLLKQQTAKEKYTTDEVAEILGRSGYTVREWCRKGQAKAEKAPNGRGWLISHEELERLRSYGPYPEKESLQGG
jgi:excisionase family DNA binding protein